MFLWALGPSSGERKQALRALHGLTGSVASEGTEGGLGPLRICGIGDNGNFRQIDIKEGSDAKGFAGCRFVPGLLSGDKSKRHLRHIAAFHQRDQVAGVAGVGEIEAKR
jgi:hypothetical protein